MKLCLSKLSTVINELNFNYGRISVGLRSFIVVGMVVIAFIAFMITSVSAESVAATEADGQWQMGKPIITYWAGPMPMTDADAKQLADGNWNLAWISARGMSKGDNVVDFYILQLDALQRHGLRGILSLGEYVPRSAESLKALDDPNTKAEIDAVVEGVRNHPALYAYGLRDEPNAAMFANLAKMKSYLEKKDPSHLVFINLLPLTASSKQLGTTGAQIPAYVDYLQQFIKTVKPKLLSYDQYHFGVKGDGLKYFLNLKLMRQATIDVNIPFINIVQACSWTKNMRIPTGEELRWLAYTSLAYGAQGICYYVYGHPWHDGGMMYPASWADETGNNGVVLGGQPTPLYYYAKELNKEFVAIATQLQPLKSLAVYHVGILPEGASPLPEDVPFKLDPAVPQKDFPVSTNKKLTADEEAVLFAEGGAHSSRVEGFVIGYFGKDNSPTHALVVNLDYRTYGGAGHLRQKEFLNPMRRAIVGSSRLEFFDVATSKWIDAEDNTVDLHLPPGGGILVRVAQ